MLFKHCYSEHENEFQVLGQIYIYMRTPSGIFIKKKSLSNLADLQSPMSFSKRRKKFMCHIIIQLKTEIL